MARGRFELANETKNVGEIEISEWVKLKEKPVDLQNIVAKFRLKTLVVMCNEFK